MEVTSYLLEEEEELEACLAAIEPEEMECHDLLVQIFSVSMKKKEFVHVTGLIKKKFPRAKVIGGKVAACISGGRGMDSGISLTFMRFMSSEVHLFGLRLDDNERAIGKDICMDWLEKRKDLAALEVLTIGHINTLSSLFSGKIWVPLFGGLLGDSTGGKEGFIYCDGEILKHGLLLVALCGQHLQVHVERSSGWLPLGPLMTITKVNGPYIVSELDGQPFEHIYSHYIGDLEDLRSAAALRETVGRMETLLETEPEFVVCDLHPRYNSSLLAREYGLPVLEIQHHYAHIASCLAENDFAGRVIGVSFDGTGYGSDGTIWGGEILTADFEGFERAAHIRPFLQIGGDASSREGWRIAVSMIFGLVRDRDRTLSDDDVNSVMKKILNGLEGLHIELRS